jgi:hypothetical protein
MVCQQHASRAKLDSSRALREQMKVAKHVHRVAKYKRQIQDQHMTMMVARPFASLAWLENLTSIMTNQAAALTVRQESTLICQERILANLVQEDSSVSLVP